jgi:hypothetical protein
MEEDIQYYEGQNIAYMDCLNLIEEAKSEGILDPRILEIWVSLRLMKNKAKVNKIIEYKEERASNLSKEDAIYELTNNRK